MEIDWIAPLPMECRIFKIEPSCCSCGNIETDTFYMVSNDKEERGYVCKDCANKIFKEMI